VFLRGRRKDMIIRGGVNIYPGEIEAVLASHPLVRDVAAVGRPAARLGEEVAVFVVVQAPVTADTLTAWCRARLAPYKVPVHIAFIETLPRNSAGKVLKQDLVARLAAEQ
jgi:acyl-CoA synthetase (AMP-forming)/AMP-acid ligase II